MTEFKEKVYELAFGDNAISKGYTDEEVLERLREFSDNALKWEEALNPLLELCEDNEVMKEVVRNYFKS